MKNFQHPTMRSMRGVMLALATTLVFTTSAAAQGFGLRGGVERTAIVTDVESGTLGTETGITLGAFVGIPLPYNFAVQAEGMYSQKIVTQQNLELAQQGEFSPDASLELGYIEIPITLAYRVPLSGPLRPRVYAGPVIGVVVNESVDLKGKEAGDIANEATLLTREAFADKEVGYMAGVGASLRLGPLPQLMFDIRYTGGLATVSQDFAGNPLARNLEIGAFSALVGIGF